MGRDSSILKNKRFQWLAISVLLLLGLFAVANPMSTMGNHSLSDSPWEATGSGEITEVSDGSSGQAEFSYKVNVDPDTGWQTACCGSGTWEFSAVAATSQTVTLDYNYTGNHRFWQAAWFIDAFVDDGTTVLTPLGSGGTSPHSGAFAFAGSVMLTVSAGDT